MRRLLRASSSLNVTVSVSGSSTTGMPCPFLSRLSSTFVKNYSGKLLKTYGDHCPVMTKHGVTAAMSQPLVSKLDGRDDTIEVRDFQSKLKVVSEVRVHHEMFRARVSVRVRIFFRGRNREEEDGPLLPSLQESHEERQPVPGSQGVL